MHKKVTVISIVTVQMKKILTAIFLTVHFLNYLLIQRALF